MKIAFQKQGACLLLHRGAMGTHLVYIEDAVGAYIMAKVMLRCI